MKHRFWGAALTGLLLFGMVFAIGCSSDDSNATTAQPQGAKANMVLQADQSAYPYLIFYNQGTGVAEQVQVVDAQRNQPLTPLGMLKKAGGTVSTLPAPNPLSLQPGEGAQIQLTSEDAMEYTVSWSEGGQHFREKLILHPPNRIETH